MSSSDDPMSTEDDPVLTWHRAIAAVHGDLRDFQWNAKQQCPRYARFTCAFGFGDDDVYTLEVAGHQSNLIGRVSPVQLTGEAVYVGRTHDAKVTRWARSEIASGIPAAVTSLRRHDYLDTFMPAATLLVAGQTRPAYVGGPVNELLHGWEIVDRLQSMRRAINADFKNRVTAIAKKLRP